MLWLCNKPTSINASEGNFIFEPLLTHNVNWKQTLNGQLLNIFKNMIGPLEAGSCTDMLPRAKGKKKNTTKRKKKCTDSRFGVLYHQIY